MVPCLFHFITSMESSVKNQIWHLTNKSLVKFVKLFSFRGKRQNYIQHNVGWPKRRFSDITKWHNHHRTRIGPGNCQLVQFSGHRLGPRDIPRETTFVHRSGKRELQYKKTDSSNALNQCLLSKHSTNSHLRFLVLIQGRMVCQRDDPLSVLFFLFQ